MWRMNGNEDSDGIVALLKETADGFGRLMANHLKLARLELFADVKTLVRRIAIMAVVVALIFLGYALSCLGLAVVASRWLGLSGSLFLLGGVHLVGSVTVLLFAVRKIHGMHLMHETAYEASQSVSTLSARILNGTVSTAAAPERKVSGEQVIAAKTEGGPPIAKTLL